MSKNIYSFSLLLFALNIASFSLADDHGNAPSKAHHAAVSVSPDQSLEWLKNGNQRFLDGKSKTTGNAKEDIVRLSKGQAPHAIVLSCSDSRVPPELVFDQKLGEIFTVRSAGESPDTTQIASIEYAIEHLGSRLIVVMGHTSCGAVKAALETPKGKSAGSESLDHLVADIQKRIGESAKTPSAGVHDESLKNAAGVKSDLIAQSKIIKSALESGKIKIVYSLYDIATGKIEWVN